MNRKKWNEFRKKHGLHSFTNPIVYVRGVIQTLEPYEKVKHVLEILDILFAEEVKWEDVEG